MWVDDMQPDRVADPEQAYQDVREAHGWVTRQLGTVSADSLRGMNLTNERSRLAGIAWKLKERLDPSVPVRPYVTPSKQR